MPGRVADTAVALRHWGRRARRISTAGPTDLEAWGLASERVDFDDRYWLLTVDFEAFTAERVGAWSTAMHRMAEAASEHRIRFEIFLAIEDVVRLRERSAAGYEEFLGGIRAMADAGAGFYPHNHCAFDPATGDRPGEPSGFPTRIEGYPRRASMFYDVVHRNRIDFTDWMTTLTNAYRGVLADAGVPVPARSAFRAGGWDHGASHDDLRAYVAGLSANGYEVDSGATSGVYGTPSWRIESPFGENAYWLTGDVLELAPCISRDLAVGLLARDNRGAAFDLAVQPSLWTRRSGGALVSVLHFDHLFALRAAGNRTPLAVFDEAIVATRIERAMRALSRLRLMLGIESVGFGDVAIPPPPGAS